MDTTSSRSGSSGPERRELIEADLKALAGKPERQRPAKVRALEKALRI